MNFQKLKYAIVVANSGSFRAASRRLYMAQSSLSTAIKELEEEYQIQIFERTKRGIFITEEGSEFLTYAEDILSQVKTLEQRYLGDNDRHMFSISGQHYDFAAEAFARLVDEESGRKDWNFRFLETSTSRVIDDVRHSYSELGILYLNDSNRRVIEQHLDHYELVFKKLGLFYPHAFLGKNHPLANLKEIYLEDLKKYPIIKFEQAKGSSLQFSEESLEGNFEGEQVIYASDRATVINLLAKTNAYLLGSGIVTSPFSLLERTIPIVDGEASEIGYIQARYRKNSELAEKYIDHLRKMVKNEK
ncbi:MULTISPECIES: LysR family transcriptional regulator [Bacteria]|uniref:Transcriptional regulator, LysR family n=1 Tax=Aerococcus christensenii TaxID=87541 RepID=A0A133Y067_9LACT|nr:LysR family transcriptional regulator [Aerococcus christensenii]KXB36573.1 transcriptional regulator, LysR family [Aerococcus christensenii]MDK8234204.1 LysR family transcriptional regulator [Aerococcus christensenii]